MKLRRPARPAQGHLHRPDRRRVHAHRRRRTAPLDATSAWKRAGGKFGRTAEDKKRILERLTAAEGLERYLHTKYVGQKRFSLEGGDALIPLMDTTDPPRRRARRQGRGHRHGPPRPPQRAGQHARQAAAPAVRRVRGQVRARPTRPRPPGRREVPHGLLAPTSPRPAARCTWRSAFNPSHLEIVDPVVAGSRAFAPEPPRRQGRASRCCRC